MLDAYLAEHPALCDRRRAEIATIARPSELADLWADVLNPEFHRVSWMLSAATRSSGASFITTRKRLQGLVGDAAANALTAGLGAARPVSWRAWGCSMAWNSLPLVRSTGTPSIAAMVTAGRTSSRSHCRGLARIRTGSTRSWLHVRTGGDELSRHAPRAGAEAQTMPGPSWSSGIPLHAKILHHQLRVWAKISRDRERARSEVIRYFWVLRAYALRAGELTGLGDDIFFLDKAEIVRVLARRDDQSDG